MPELRRNVSHQAGMACRRLGVAGDARSARSKVAVLLAAVACSCTSTVAVTPTQATSTVAVTPTQATSTLRPIAEASAITPSSPGLTLAERAARYEQMVQANQPSVNAGTRAPSASDYAPGYPHLTGPPPPRPDGTLQSFMLLDTGPYLANQAVHDLSWTNSTGRRLAIYKLYLWTGADKGAIADIHVEARRASDGSVLGILQWDHYADPTVPQHGQQFDYSTPMMLDANDTILIKHFATGFSPGWHAHHVAILWIKQ